MDRLKKKKKKKRNLLSGLQWNHHETSQISYNVLFTLKSQVDQNFIKDLMKFSFLFFFFFNEFVNRQKGKVEIH